MTTQHPRQSLTAEFSVTKQVEFDAGHRVPLHLSKCRTPHGHRYVVKATCVGSPVAERAPDEGMVIDFADLKEWLASEVSGPLDHSFMLHEGDLPMRRALEEGMALDKGLSGEEGWRVVCLPVVPTAENLAKWCYDRLQALVEDHWRNVVLYEVEVWETPTSMARYRPQS